MRIIKKYIRNLTLRERHEINLFLEMMRLIYHENKQILPHKEVIEILNLESNEENKEVKIGKALPTEIKKEIISLLHEFTYVFAWSYQDMSGLSTGIV